MAAKKSIFQSTRQNSVSVSVKIPQELKERIEALRESLAAVDQTLTFNISAICAETLEIAVKTGEAELAKMKPAANGTGASEGARV
ncbi:MAG: hypothetical protein NXH95_14385 [Pseudomonadaceae bacterium]|nr:hypothetical protein [Pseudomonadaceae bacterium]